jgi:hypothetical protein
MRSDADSMRAEVDARGGLVEGLVAFLRSGLRAESQRRQQVAHARSRVDSVKLDDAGLLEGIAASLLAASRLS